MKFRGEYYFLSNMYPAEISIELHGKNYTFKCSESLYQAFKCCERFDDFVDLNGWDAKRLSKSLPIRENWNDIKLDVMHSILVLKFEQNKELIDKLVNVKGDIVEDNTWGDFYWGVCNGIGQNMLGRLLMSLRNKYSNNIKEM